MFGIEDPQIWVAYALCIVSALGAVIYGMINWDKGDEPVYTEDKKWVESEKQAEDDL